MKTAIGIAAGIGVGIVVWRVAMMASYALLFSSEEARRLETIARQGAK